MKPFYIFIAFLIVNPSYGQWAKSGLDIDGEAADDLSGWTVSMPDTITVAIGEPQNDSNGVDSSL